MSLQKIGGKKIHLRALRRRNRVRGKQSSRGVKPRVCVFRSLKNIYAQVIDDSENKVIASYSSLNLKGEQALDKKAIAHKVGLELGKLTLGKNIKEAFFDRGNYLYHGRVRSLVEGLREGGLQL